MSQCEFCKTESTIIFTCPHCGDRFCKEHRRPEKHNCPTIENDVERPPINKNPPLEQNNIEETLMNITQTLDQKSKNPQLNYQTLDESLEIVKAQSRAVLANLFGTLNDPEDYDEENKEKYDKIYDYFLKAWKKKNELEIQIKHLKNEISELKDQLDKKTVEYEKLLAECK
jgi:DNA repair exonuclease SbcCD ATPase subunit